MWHACSNEGHSHLDQIQKYISKTVRSNIMKAFTDLKKGICNCIIKFLRQSANMSDIWNLWLFLDMSGLQQWNILIHFSGKILIREAWKTAFILHLLIKWEVIANFRSFLVNHNPKRTSTLLLYFISLKNWKMCNTFPICITMLFCGRKCYWQNSAKHRNRVKELAIFSTFSPNLQKDFLMIVWDRKSVV